ncbi:uncharacterized protein LOC110180542 isoform X2 [Drosophila serrata]|uniref:uncharacterized protein LOC110180542 isoform X2 n=1 Tax=Drosophila serrata TaxID=7274 RepID=UPI000A1D2636|nr:uncharacterized protein LOC110180542 isoform X2 [Drosophila serrata]
MDSILFSFITDHADHIDVYKETYDRPKPELLPIDPSNTDIEVEIEKEMEILKSKKLQTTVRSTVESAKAKVDLSLTPLDFMPSTPKAASHKLNFQNLNKQETSSNEESEPITNTTKSIDDSVRESTECEALSILNNALETVAKGKRETKKQNQKKANNKHGYLITKKKTEKRLRIRNLANLKNIPATILMSPVKHKKPTPKN